MKYQLPPKLKSGDTIRVIAPSTSMAIISDENRKVANQRFQELGLKVTFGKHIYECDQFTSSSIKSRITDLHEAFSDPEVKGIFTVIGGHNSNQLLDYIDYDLIRANPKVFCGYSDITALSNAILKMAGLITYSGPHYSTLAMEQGLDYTLEWLKKTIIESIPCAPKPAPTWSDDEWYLDQHKRKFNQNSGYLVIQEGECEGVIIGGNLCTFNLLHGTKYMPNLDKAVLFIEDDTASDAMVFDRDLQSVIHQADFDKVQGIVIGRFQEGSKISNEDLISIIKTKEKLKYIPVLANVDFGHTTPHLTLPIGGRVTLKVRKDQRQITY